MLRCVGASSSLGMQVSQAEASASFDRYHSGNFFLTQPSAGEYMGASD